ncbi:zinc finger protein 184-like [Motacilla alba alba]|uniref:zinc finger protein 184-like n=1 Tax=Motacilla alba alba TaxID=1094192 RepID=UPI0018D4FBF5|nr:zinc finger protein 184-like [Motacilla alba alba]
MKKEQEKGWTKKEKKAGSRRRKRASTELQAETREKKLPWQNIAEEDILSASTVQESNREETPQRYPMRKGSKPSPGCSKEERPTLCQEGSQSFSQNSDLVVYKQHHIDEKHYRKDFSDGSNLIIHRSLHTGEQSYKCEEHRKSFSWSSNLLSHQLVHTGEWPYQCPTCRKTFSFRSHLIYYQKIHSEERPYKYPECGKSFRRYFHLALTETREDKSLHQNLMEEAILSDSMAQEYNGEEKLQWYPMRRVSKHSPQWSSKEERPILCQEGGQSFIQRYGLVVLEWFHIGEMCYRSLECGKSFRWSCYLIWHQKIHMEERP